MLTCSIALYPCPVVCCLRRSPCLQLSTSLGRTSSCALVYIYGPYKFPTIYCDKWYRREDGVLLIYCVSYTLSTLFWIKIIHRFNLIWKLFLKIHRCAVDNASECINYWIGYWYPSQEWHASEEKSGICYISLDVAVDGRVNNMLLCERPDNKGRM